MPQRTVTWTAIGRARLDRVQVPAGFVGARVLAQGFAKYQRRPLAAPTGAYDRSAIMAAASYAADRLQEQYGLSRREALSTALKATWQAARIARSAAAH